jgi:hypothetical protein
VAKIVIGIALIAGAVLTGGLLLPAMLLTDVMFVALEAIAVSVASMGASLLMGGIASALQHGASANIAVRQSSAPWQIVYGRARIGGVFAYLSVTNNKKYLHMVIVHAAHPCHAINGYWLDGRQVIFAGGGQSGYDDGNTHIDPTGNKYNFHNDVYVENRLGTETGQAFASLQSYDSNWPSSATLQGHCCSYIRCAYDQNLWPNGYPTVRVDIAGRNDLFDPRTGLYGYSENSALCLANVLTNTDYGLQCNYNTAIDNTQLIASANLCDETVALANGGSEPMYSCNGTFDTSMAPNAIISNMLNGCAGRVTCVGGLWRIVAGGWISPTVSFTDDDIVGPIKWMPVRKYRDRANGVRGRFVCPSFPYNQYGPGYPNNIKAAGIFDGQWQACDMPYYAEDSLHGYASDQYLAQDNNTRLWIDTTFPYTTSVATAQRIAKIMLLRNRQQGIGTIQVGLKGLQCSALDTIYLSHSRWGWTNKVFEVTAWRLQMQEARDGNGPLAYVEMDIQEADPSVYSWTTSEELGIEDNPSPVLPGRGIISQATFAPVSSANLNSAILGGINPLTASDVGTSCDINTAAFQLQLGWGVVNYNAGVDHGCAYSTRYYVYTKDATFAGGSMTYYAVLTFAACVSAQENVYVGSIVTPAAGASGTTGAGVGGGDSIQVRGYYGTMGTPNVGTWEYVGGLATNEPGGTTTYTYRSWSTRRSAALPPTPAPRARATPA